MGVGERGDQDWTRFGAFAPADAPQVSDDDAAARKEGLRIKTLWDNTRKEYDYTQAGIDRTNLSFFQGTFYKVTSGAVIPQQPPEPAATAPSQNETFPVVDAIKTALVRDCPQVELVDERYVPEGEDRADPWASALAAVYNYIAREARLGAMALPDVVLMAALFDRGGYFKVAWDEEQQRPTITARGPDEVFIDPLAREWGDVTWAAERFDLDDEDMKKRRDEKMYTATPGEWQAIQPELADTRVIGEAFESQEENAARRDAGQKWHRMVEWWDVRKGVVYHLHQATGVILATFAAPVRLPYVQLVFHKIPRKLAGVSDVSLIRDNQRAINNLVTTREEMVGRLVRKLAYDPDVFLNETEEKKFLQARAWQPSRLKTSDIPPERRFFVSPEMPTTFDFNQHLRAMTESARYTSGIDGWQRGKAQNIRTASEAQMLAGAETARGDARVMLVDEVLREVFEAVRQYLKWAIQQPDASKLDVGLLYALTQRSANAERTAAFGEELLRDRRTINILPFSTAGKQAKRQNLTSLLQAFFSTPLAAEVSTERMAKALVDLFDLPPSILATPDEKEQIKQAMAAAAGGAPGGAGGAPGEAAAPAEGGAAPPPEGGEEALLGGDPAAPTPEEIAAQAEPETGGEDLVAQVMALAGRGE